MPLYSKLIDLYTNTNTNNYILDVTLIVCTCIEFNLGDDYCYLDNK